MAQTPLSTSTYYASPADTFVYHDWQQVADVLRDGDDPRPTRAGLLDSTSDAGAMLVRFLKLASGEIESACLVGQRYTPSDLAALTGAGAELLKKLTADLCFYRLTERRQPASSDPKQIPGAASALTTLQMLESGERVFPFTETADAGIGPDVVEPRPSEDGPMVVRRAAKLFGTHGTDQWGSR